MSPARSTSTAHPPASGNIAVLRGEIATIPADRELRTGSVIVHFDVATSAPAARTGGGSGSGERVPVAWPDPPSRARALVEPGATVVVVGRVRRRFFRAGGVTQSRTEVVATQVVPARRRAATAKLLDSVVDEVGALRAGRR